MASPFQISTAAAVDDESDPWASVPTIQIPDGVSRASDSSTSNVNFNSTSQNSNICNIEVLMRVDSSDSESESEDSSDGGNNNSDRGDVDMDEGSMGNQLAEFTDLGNPDLEAPEDVLTFSNEDLVDHDDDDSLVPELRQAYGHARRQPPSALAVLPQGLAEDNYVAHLRFQRR